MGAGGEAEGLTCWSVPPLSPQAGSAGKNIAIFPLCFCFPINQIQAQQQEQMIQLLSCLFGIQRKHMACKMKGKAQSLVLQAYTWMADPPTNLSEGPKEEKPLSAALC